MLKCINLKKPQKIKLTIRKVFFYYICDLNIIVLSTKNFWKNALKLYVIKKKRLLTYFCPFQK